MLRIISLNNRIINQGFKIHKIRKECSRSNSKSANRDKPMMLLTQYTNSNK